MRPEGTCAGSECPSFEPWGSHGPTGDPLPAASLLCGPYQVVGGDGNRENFDPQEFCFIGSIIQASTGLLVTFQGMSISHYNQVFILLVMGTTRRD